MKRLWLVPAAALVGVATFAPVASAHVSNASSTTACVDGDAVVSAAFDNDYPTDAAVTVLGQTVTLPALGEVTVTGPYAAELGYTVVWSDEYTQAGTLTPGVVTDGCTPLTEGCPAVGERVNGPTCVHIEYPAPTPWLYPCPIEYPAGCEAPATPILGPGIPTQATPVEVETPAVVAEPAPPVESPTLAFTGSQSELLCLLAGALIGGGSVCCWIARRAAR